MTNINAVGGATYTPEKRSGATADAGDFKAEFSAILSAARSSMRETLEEMNERQKELDTVKNERETNETLLRLMPDGSIRITEIENGRVASVSKYRPHMQTVIDESQPLPKNEDGTADLNAAQTKLEPTFGIFNMPMPSSF